MFGCIYDLFVTTLNSVQMDQSGAINAKVRATKSHLNLSLQTRTWDHFSTALNSVQNGPNWCNKCKSSCHEVVSELFATNAPDPHHWTLNSCFVAFRKVWVHLGSFCYCTKLGAKWAVLANWCKSSCHEVASELFATNAWVTLHGTLNSCFVAYRKVWEH